MNTPASPDKTTPTWKTQGRKKDFTASEAVASWKAEYKAKTKKNRELIKEHLNISKSQNKKFLLNSQNGLMFMNWKKEIITIFDASKLKTALGRENIGPDMHQLWESIEGLVNHFDINKKQKLKNTWEKVLRLANLHYEDINRADRSMIDKLFDYHLNVLEPHLYGPECRRRRLQPAEPGQLPINQADEECLEETDESNNSKLLVDPTSKRERDTEFNLYPELDETLADFGGGTTSLHPQPQGSLMDPVRSTQHSHVSSPAPMAKSSEFSTSSLVLTVAAGAVAFTAGFLKLKGRSATRGPKPAKASVDAGAAPSNSEEAHLTVDAAPGKLVDVTFQHGRTKNSPSQ
eukprot:GHVT01054702.1.p1 GENE.GHVT01054702.1~~GHVT01054702.1.p1  ORF type:complete len:347 (+),score=37.38 GHVT01054702.1:2230-3270(+)